MSKRKDPADAVVQYFLDQPLPAAKQLLAICQGIVRRAEAAANPRPPAARKVKVKHGPKPKVSAPDQTIVQEAPGV